MHEIAHRFDRVVAGWMKLLPEWLTPFMKGVTMLGEPVVTIGAGVVLGVWGVAKSNYRLTLSIVLGYAAFGLDTLIKHLVHRVRPDTLFVRGMKIKSYSFPSGHAFGSMFFYGLLAYLAYTRLPQPWNFVMALLLAVLIFLIGGSRVFLGAHFPSDVVVGWLWGVLSLSLVLYFLRP